MDKEIGQLHRDSWWSCYRTAGYALMPSVASLERHGNTDTLLKHTIDPQRGAFAVGSSVSWGIAGTPALGRVGSFCYNCPRIPGAAGSGVSRPDRGWAMRRRVGEGI